MKEVGKVKREREREGGRKQGGEEEKRRDEKEVGRGRHGKRKWEKI